MKYDNGKIYKLVCNETGLVYIGSTIQPLYKRKHQHKNHYESYENGKFPHYLSSYEILKHNNYDIILIENFPCTTKEELHSRERYWIENTDCVNKCIPTRTQKEYQEVNKEKYIKYHKEYFIKNKEKISENKKKRWYVNKEKLNEKQRQYYQDNKEKCLKMDKQYRDANKDEINRIRREKKYLCECGIELGFYDRHKHFKTKNHLAYLESKKT